jgi:hypothetical protein
MSNVRYLIDDSISTDTVKALTTLLEQARKGTITGIAFVAYLKGRPYIANFAGYAYRNPALTRGILRDLDYKLHLRNQALRL